MWPNFRPKLDGLTVKPEVSDGSIDALGLPSTTTTEVQTNILLPDGKGMVIGGLIKETDVTQQQKIPVLGSLWRIGKLFRRDSVTRERSEIIIALIPHIVGGPHFDGCRESETRRRCRKRSTAKERSTSKRESPKPNTSRLRFDGEDCQGNRAGFDRADWRKFTGVRDSAACHSKWT
ncbi:MAG: hypothetical protein H7Z17_01905 [Fuerstia sp.]|nr:hypothetical protein [Fuerstiella sp.]